MHLTILHCLQKHILVCLKQKEENLMMLQSTEMCTSGCMFSDDVRDCLYSPLCTVTKKKDIKYFLLRSKRKSSHEDCDHVV